MSNLVVVSERDISNNLINMGIRCDLFFTDLTEFKNRSSVYMEMDIVFIFAGACRFSKRFAVDFIKSLKKRADNPHDKGVTSLKVLSDYIIDTCDEYYLYRTDIRKGILYNKGKVQKSGIVNVFETWAGDTIGEKFLISSDMDAICDNFKNTAKFDSEYLDLIQIPVLSVIDNK